MADPLYTSFSSVRVNRNRRKELFRAARLGTRPAPIVPDFGDALRTIDAAAAYRDGWVSSTESLPVVVRSAWAAREGA